MMRDVGSLFESFKEYLKWQMAGELALGWPIYAVGVGCGKYYSPSSSHFLKSATSAASDTRTTSVGIFAAHAAHAADFLPMARGKPKFSC
jgi:hypothetical protein